MEPFAGIGVSFFQGSLRIITFGAGLSFAKQGKEAYFIDLQDDAFFNKLAIHLQNLYNRSRYEHFTRNSNLLDIKKEFHTFFEPFIEIDSDPVNVKQLMRTENFTEFMLKLKRLITEST